LIDACVITVGLFVACALQGLQFRLMPPMLVVQQALTTGNCRMNPAVDTFSLYYIMQGHAGSKTLHQQNPPVLNWRCRLTQVDLYNDNKTVVVVVVSLCIYEFCFCC